MRTNVRRAREAGVECLHQRVPAWTRAFEDPDLAQVGPAERWWAIDRDGDTVGEAWLTVDEQCALLHALHAKEQDVRWLLHTTIVERLCASRCRLLLTNSYDAPLMGTGQQYFQRLLGYTVARLRPQIARGVAPHTSRSRRLAAVGLLAMAAATAIVAQQILASQSIWPE